MSFCWAIPIPGGWATTYPGDYLYWTNQADDWWTGHRNSTMVVRYPTIQEATQERARLLAAGLWTQETVQSLRLIDLGKALNLIGGEVLL